MHMMTRLVFFLSGFYDIWYMMHIWWFTLCVFCLVSAQNDLTVKPASLLLSKGCLLVVDVSGEDSDENDVGDAKDGEDKEASQFHQCEDLKSLPL